MKTVSQDPNPVLDPIVPVITAHALVASVSAGLFEALSRGSSDSETVAFETGLEPHATKLLLDVLAANGYVSFADGVYELTDVSRMTLLASSPMSFANWVRFCRFQIEAAGHLGEAMRGSGAIRVLDELASAEDLLVHQRALAETAKPIAPWIANVVPVPDRAGRMLDIGGSHGVYSAGLCAKHPPMRSDILELPEAVEPASVVAEEYGTKPFCSFVGANVLEWESTAWYDAVFLGNIIHHFSATEVECVLEKSYHCLVDEGTIAIWDIDAGGNRADPTAAAFSLFFFMTSGAKCYASDEIGQILERVGFANHEVLRPPGSSSHSLHIARKTV